MSRKKTRQQKQKTSAKRSDTTTPIAFDESILKGVSTTSSLKQSNTKKSEILVGYDSKLLQKDIFKTIFISALVFAIEIGLYWYLRLR